MGSGVYRCGLRSNPSRSRRSALARKNRVYLFPPTAHIARGTGRQRLRRGAGARTPVFPGDGADLPTEAAVDLGALRTKRAALQAGLDKQLAGIDKVLADAVGAHPGGRIASLRHPDADRTLGRGLPRTSGARSSNELMIVTVMRGRHEAHFRPSTAESHWR